jgi:pseudouridine synthase
MTTIIAFFLLFSGALFRDVIGLSSKFSRQKLPITSKKASNEKERTVVILFYKPPNVISSHLSDDLVPLSSNKDQDLPVRTTVYSEIYSMQGFVEAGSEESIKSFEQATGIRSELNAIGRLDVDTTGLLLLTNDGGLIHHVTNPNASTHGTEGAITKTYQALIMGHHPEATSGALEQLWRGVDIGAKYGGMTKPVHDLSVLDHSMHKKTLISISISEGKNRQVRRMFHAIGSGVMQLKRTNIGEHLTLGDLKEGQWRLLMDGEIRQSLHWEPRVLFSKNNWNDMGSQSRPAKTTGTVRQRRRRR